MNFIKIQNILMVSLMLGILLTCGYKIYVLKKEPTFSLIKNEWSCTKENQTIMYQYVGDTAYPNIINDCVEYTRNKGGN